MHRSTPFSFGKAGNRTIFSGRADLSATGDRQAAFTPRMPSPTLRDQLAQAERRVSRGEATLAHQRKVVAELERDHPKSDALKLARSLLQAMEGAMENLIAQRNRLKREVDQQ